MAISVPLADLSVGVIGVLTGILRSSHAGSVSRSKSGNAHSYSGLSIQRLQTRGRAIL
jgi:hypothetical protein